MSNKLQVGFFFSVIFILITKTNQQNFFRLLQLNSGQVIIKQTVYLIPPDFNSICSVTSVIYIK